MDNYVCFVSWENMTCHWWVLGKRQLDIDRYKPMLSASEPSLVQQLVLSSDPICSTNLQKKNEYSDPQPQADTTTDDGIHMSDSSSSLLSALSAGEKTIVPQKQHAWLPSLTR